MPFTCAVPNCEDKTSTRHRLPNPQKSLVKFNNWLEVIGNDMLKILEPAKVYNNYRICHRHFAVEQLCTNMYLKPNAIPTLFLPVRNIQQRQRGAEELDKLSSSSTCGVEPEHDTMLITPEEQRPLNIALDKPVAAIETLSLFDTPTTRNALELPMLNNRCRTCLSVVDASTSKEITASCLLDKPIKDVIIFLVPELDSKLDDKELVCHDCVNILETTMKFIVKCLEVEEALENSKQSITNSSTDCLVNDNPQPVDAEHDYCVKTASQSDSCSDCQDEDVRQEYDSLSHAAEMMEQSLQNYCGQSYEVPSEKYETVSTALSCVTCSETFASKEDHELHLILHPPHVCDVCGKAFKKKDSLRAHGLTHNDPNSFICEVCGKGFKEQGSLRYHLKGHGNGESCMCDKCSKVFRTRRLLDVHVKYVHDKCYECQCTVCGIMCRNRGSLNTHVRLVHFKEKPHECDVCHRRFGRSDYLQNHKKVCHVVQSRGSDNKPLTESRKRRRRTRLSFKIMNTGEPVACKFCGQWYKDLVRLKRHLETHLKRYPCQFCSLTFPRNVLRQKHEEMHRGGTVSFFRCNVCWKKYRTKEALDEHSACHNNPQHFCDLCGKTFNRKFLLSQHKMTEHSSIPDREQPEEIILDSLLEAGGVST